MLVRRIVWMKSPAASWLWSRTKNWIFLSLVADTGSSYCWNTTYHKVNHFLLSLEAPRTSHWFEQKLASVLLSLLLLFCSAIMCVQRLLSSLTPGLELLCPDEEALLQPKNGSESLFPGIYFKHLNRRTMLLHLCNWMSTCWNLEL